MVRPWLIFTMLGKLFRPPVKTGDDPSRLRLQRTHHPQETTSTIWLAGGV